jgi:uncharacterized protein YecT (DUF1311 family)
METAMFRAAALLVLLAWIDPLAHACGDHPVWQDPAVRNAQNELVDAYELALNASSQKELLDMGQQAWNEYLQANCALMSDREGEPALEPLAQCIAFMTRQRTLELRLLSYPSVSP